MNAAVDHIPSRLCRQSDYFPELYGFKPATTCGHRLGSVSGFVQVFSRGSVSSYHQPWTKSQIQAATGIGFVVDLKLRLIIAYVNSVDSTSKLLLRRPDCDIKFHANILAISDQFNILVLSVNDEGFWHGASAMEFGLQIPLSINQSVDLVSYAPNNETLHISSGSVSGMDFVPCNELIPQERFRCVYVKAVPSISLSCLAIIEKKLVGIIPSSKHSALCMIPISLLYKTLQDFKISVLKSNLGVNLDTQNGTLIWPICEPTKLVQLQGFAYFAPIFQSLGSFYLRLSSGLNVSTSGVIIRSVPVTSKLHSVLQCGDVLVSIDDVRICNDGTLAHPRYNNIYEYISTKLVGEELKMTISRNGSLQSLVVPTERPNLSPLLHRSSERFVMFAGYIFVPLSVQSHAYGTISVDDIKLALGALRKKYPECLPGQQCIVLSNMLPHNINLDVSLSCLHQPIYLIDGHPIHRLEDIALVLAQCTSQFVTITFCDDSAIVVPLADGFAATYALQQEYSMPNTMSSDVAAILYDQDQEYCISKKYSAKRILRMLDYTLLDLNATDAELEKFCSTANMYLPCTVCVFTKHVKFVRTRVNSSIRVAAVAGGFPVGTESVEDIQRDIRTSIADGADEIDCVLEPRMGDTFPSILERVMLDAMREAAGSASLKVIIETPLLSETSMRSVADMVLQSGADFVKSCTGKRGECTSAAARVLAEAVRDFELSDHASNDKTSKCRGLKLSGGIRTHSHADELLKVVEGVYPAIFSHTLDGSRVRIGASSLMSSLVDTMSSCLTSLVPSSSVAATPSPVCGSTNEIGFTEQSLNGCKRKRQEEVTGNNLY